MKLKGLTGIASKITTASFIGLLSFALCSVVFAEDKKPKESVITSLEISGELANNYFGFDNGDLTNTDNTSYSTVDNTDDRMFVGESVASLTVDAGILDFMKVCMELGFSGYWGNDSLSYDNSIYAKQLYFEVDLARSLFSSDAFDWTVNFGRQGFQIMDYDDHKNYIMNDTVDALLLKVFFPSIKIGGQFLMDFFSLNSPADDVYSLKTDRHSYTVSHFNGDVNIFRFGLLPQFLLENEKSLMKTLDVKAVLLFTRIGATGYGDYNSGGYERSAMGFEGNYADNDWVLIAGGDAFLDLTHFSTLLEVAYSTGVDRKAVGVPDVVISGLLLHGSLDVNFGFVGWKWLKLGFDGLYVTGASTDEYGNYLNYGFVSFKGDKQGGFLFSKYYGAYPSAIVDYGGIDFETIEPRRRAPVVSIGFNTGIDKLFQETGDDEDETGLYVDFSGWLYWDTSTTSMNTNLTLEAHIYDQRRWGKYMGLELNADASYTFTKEVLEIGVKGGIFLPGEFFTYPVSINDAPYGVAPFWGFEIYTTVKF